MKSRRMRWAGYVAHMREMRSVYKILIRKPEAEKLGGVDGRIVLEWILGK
jgi:hypothetical protein